MVSTVRPKASATPKSPMPTFGNAAASTALPHPPNTSQKVPINSAAARLVSGIIFSSIPFVRYSWECTFLPPPQHAPIAAEDEVPLLDLDQKSGEEHGRLARNAMAPTIPCDARTSVPIKIAYAGSTSQPK